MPEQWRTFKLRKPPVERPLCRFEIEDLVAKGIMTLEEIADTGRTEWLRRQARTMWREKNLSQKSPKLLRNKKPPEKLQTGRGRFRVSFCLGSYEYPGTEEEARGKAVPDVRAVLTEWKEDQVPLDELFRRHGYIYIEPIDMKTAARGKSPAIAVKR